MDTNAFIYFLGGEEPYFSILKPVFRRVQGGELSFIVSVITEAELLVRPERQEDELARERIADLLSEDGIYVVSVDRRIARRAAVLRGRSGLKLADAIIVATAIETGCDAVVSNDGEWGKKQIDIPFVGLDDIVANQAAP
ncbi:MAG TPA: PIN domain-containing protein [Dehalococcoidia bacterium]|nr:PIN domain-containing protein [Dehalococcoidia bacterium]